MITETRPFRRPLLAGLALAIALPAVAGAQTYWFERDPRRAAFISQSEEGPERARVVVSAMGRSYLGVQLIDITDELRAFYGASEDTGVLVSRVAEDSPAAAAGFEVGDLITRIDDEEVKSSRQIVRKVGRMDPETEVAVEVVRGGAPETLMPVLAEREGGAVWFSGDFEMPELEELDILREELPRVMIDTDAVRDAMREASEALRERVSGIDMAELAERLAATEARLRELERKLAERER